MSRPTYWEYHDTLFENMNGLGRPGSRPTAVDQFKAYAAEMGLDTEDSFAECLETGRYISGGDQRLLPTAPRTASAARRRSFWETTRLDTTYISGARPYSEFQFAIEQILSSIEQ